jgi:hypothetical protein
MDIIFKKPGSAEGYQAFKKLPLPHLSPKDQNSSNQLNDSLFCRRINIDTSIRNQDYTTQIKILLQDHAGPYRPFSAADRGTIVIPHLQYDAETGKAK